MRCSQIFAWTLCAALGAVAVAGDDWPQFRGPGEQGIADVADPPIKWSETENVAWKSPIPGLGWSSPAVVDGRVYVTTAVPQEGDVQSLRAICLDARTGKELWNEEIFRQTGQVEIHTKNSHASPSPIVSGDRVFVHFGPHGTAALDRDGQVLWKNEELEYGPTHGNGGSPALLNDRLIICCDGHDRQFVVALSVEDGKPLWQHDRGLDPSRGFSFGTPLVITVDSRQQAICPGSDAVLSLDPATGNEIWRLKYEGYSVVPRPIYAGGLVILSTGYDNPKLLAIDPTGSGDVTETNLRWTIDRGAPNNPSPVAVGEELYFVSDNGILSCVDLKTGKKRWQERLGGAFSASLLSAGGLLYAQDENGRGIVFEPGTKFKQVSENVLGDGERTYASYAAIDGALFIRNESQLYRIGASKDVANTAP